MREIIQRGYAPHFQLWAGSMNKLSCQKVVRPKPDQPDRQRRPCTMLLWHSHFFGCIDLMERGTVEWNGGTVEWWNGGMVEWWNVY